MNIIDKRLVWLDVMTWIAEIHRFLSEMSSCNGDLWAGCTRIMLWETWLTRVASLLLSKMSIFLPALLNSLLLILHLFLNLLLCFLGFLCFCFGPPMVWIPISFLPPTSRFLEHRPIWYFSMSILCIFIIKIKPLNLAWVSLMSGWHDWCIIRLPYLCSSTT